jgi:hypothetical protein
MSYIAKKGRAAAESATQEKQDASKALVSFKSGMTIKVRVPSTEDFVEWYCHSVFKKFHSTPCTKPTGTPDLYDKAVDLLYKDAKAAELAGKTDKAEELRNQAYLLKAKPKYLFGFFNLADGQPIVIDVSKKQAQVIIAAIDKFAKKLDKTAFELTKAGASTSTVVSMTPVLDIADDLTDAERKHFEATAGKAFPESLFGEVLYVKAESEQITDLQAFGFDVSRLGVSAGADDVTAVDDGGDEAELGF